MDGRRLFWLEGRDDIGWVGEFVKGEGWEGLNIAAAAEVDVRRSFPN